MSMNTDDRGRSFAEKILTEIMEIRAELGTLRQFAHLLGLPPKGETESFMTATMRLLGLLVSGTEESHRRLEALTAMVADPRMTAALRSAILDV